MNETWWVSESSLDAQQQSVISLDIDGDFLITGPPGSGKTNLLLLRAKYLTLAGRPNIKIVLFTRALREFIASGATQYSFSSSDVVTSHTFWHNLLQEYGIPRPGEARFDIYRRRLIDRAMQLVNANGISGIYQTILLDEAHDFLPEEIELFSRLGQQLFAVADHRQKIYSGETPFPVLEEVTDETIVLRHHYRNGYEICRIADCVGRDRTTFEAISPSSNYDEESRPSTVSGHRCVSLDEEIDRVFGKLDDQLDAYPEELIGIISPSRAAIQRVWDRICRSKYSAIASYQGDGEHLLFDGEVRLCVATLHSAKGLEFRALHVVSSEAFRGRPLPRGLAFTAATRAKTSLDLYYSGPLIGFLDEAMTMFDPPTELPAVRDMFPEE